MKYLTIGILILTICNGSFASETYVAFTGKSKSAKVEKISFGYTNACGLISTKYENIVEIYGSVVEGIEAYVYLGEWCRGGISLPYADQFIVAKKTEYGWEELYKTTVRTDKNGGRYITPFFAALHLDCKISSFNKNLDQPLLFRQDYERFNKENLELMKKGRVSS